MVELLPPSPFAQVGLLLAVAAVPYAYMGRYKASLVFGAASVAVFVVQLLGWFTAPHEELVRSGGQVFRVVRDPLEDELALQPAELLAGQVWWTPLTHMFVHADFFHIFANMLSLFFFGPKLEQHIGTRNFANLYLAAGFLAALVSLALFPDSMLRMVGASGAISGVLGLYVLRFPKDRIFIPIGFIPIALPAWGFLLVFIGLQFYISLAGSGIAWWAHLAGLAVGLAVGGWMWAAERRRRGGRYRPEAGAGWSVEYYGR